MFDILITVPCYNEEEILQNTVEELHKFCSYAFKDLKWIIVIGDNASTDKTAEIGKKLSKNFKEVEYFHLNKKGRGYVLREIWNKYDSNIYLYTDADLSTSVTHIKEIVDAISNGCEIAIGSRLMNSSTVSNRTFFREVVSRTYNKIIRATFKVKFHDGQCGFKGISKNIKENILPQIKDNYWFFDTEMLILAENLNYKICEIPVNWKDRDRTSSKVRVFKDSIYFLKEIRRLKKELKKKK